MASVIFLVTAILTITVVTAQTECDVEYSRFNATSGICECMRGYEGDGSLCCTPIDQNDVCYFSGDPFLHSINGVIVPVNLPCSICLNVMEGRSNSGKACRFEVLGSSTIGEYGAMYNAVLKFGVSINRKSPRYFTIYNGEVKDSSTNTILALSPDNTASIEQEGVSIDFKYNSETGFWSVEGCGNKITARLTEDMEKGRPGVCMLAAKGSSKTPMSRGNLCNVESSFKPEGNVPVAYGVARSALLMRRAFDREQLMSHPDYDEICQTTIDEQLDNVQFCMAPDGRDPFQVCGPLLYNSVLRSCLVSGGTKGPALTTLFGNCLAALCDGNGDACSDYRADEALKACQPSMRDCESWL